MQNHPLAVGYGIEMLASLFVYSVVAAYGCYKVAGHWEHMWRFPVSILKFVKSLFWFKALWVSQNLREQKTFSKRFAIFCFSFAYYWRETKTKITSKLSNSVSFVSRTAVLLAKHVSPLTFTRSFNCHTLRSVGQIRNFLPTDENVNLLREVQMIETSGVGAGVKAQPQRFWFFENPGEILENTGKIPENSDTNVSTPSNKTEWNTFENDFFLQNFAPDEISWRPFFGLHGIFVAQKCIGKLGKICVKFHLVFFATNVHLDRTHKYHRQTSSDLIRLHQYNTHL